MLLSSLEHTLFHRTRGWRVAEVPPLPQAQRHVRVVVVYQARLAQVGMRQAVQVDPVADVGAAGPHHADALAAYVHVAEHLRDVRGGVVALELVGGGKDADLVLVVVYAVLGQGHVLPHPHCVAT